MTGNSVVFKRCRNVVRSQCFRPVFVSLSWQIHRSEPFTAGNIDNIRQMAYFERKLVASIKCAIIGRFA